MWWFNVFAIFIQVSANVAEVIPIWNIGHMVNALGQLDEFLDLGANAIEADFSFDSEGNAQWTYHGFPCDCFRNCKKYAAVDDYLKYVGELTEPTSPKFRKNFALLMIDLKISWMNNNLKYKAGEDVADRIIRYLWSGKSKLWLLFTFPYTTDADFVFGFRDTIRKRGYGHMEPRIGWDISGNEDLEIIRQAYVRLNITGVWQGDGITNCLPRTTKRLVDAVRKRNSGEKKWSLLSKVYYWTLDKESTMRDTLRLGVDGIITNHPHRFVTVLSDSEFSATHRFATIEDNPWVRVERKTKFTNPSAADRIIYECNPTSGIDENIYYSDVLKYFKKSSNKTK